jgi:hypothetical protein
LTGPLVVVVVTKDCKTASKGDLDNITFFHSLQTRVLFWISFLWFASCCWCGLAILVENFVSGHVESLNVLPVCSCHE